jgi:hypothetical protein
VCGTWGAEANHPSLQHVEGLGWGLDVGHVHLACGGRLPYPAHDLVSLCVATNHIWRADVVRDIASDSLCGLRLMHQVLFAIGSLFGTVALLPCLLFDDLSLLSWAALPPMVVNAG